MKIYKVTIEFETVIAAESAQDAENQAQSIIRDGDDECTLNHAKEITALNQLPTGWNGECIPWGEKVIEDKRLKNILPANSPTSAR